MNEDIYLQDPVSEAIAEERESEEAEQNEAEKSTDPLPDEQGGEACDECAEPLHADPTEDLDPASRSVPPTPALDRMEALERELAELKNALLRQTAEEIRMERECDEFSQLYPNTPLESLPDSVWSDVRRGIPIAAAYALAERRKLCDRQLADQINAQNQMRSAGSLNGTQDNYFSPAEVREMSPAEVRKNYQKIMQSMPKWHK